MRDEILLGAHVSITGGFVKSVDRAESLGCTTFQIFTRNQVQWKVSELPYSDALAFQNRIKESKVKVIIAHSSYLINLATPDHNIRKKSFNAFFTELERCKMLNIPYYVLHPGSHRGAGIKNGIKSIAVSLKKAVDSYGDDVTVCVETMSGQGNIIGSKFEEISEIINMVGGNIGVCLDTCHIFSAGYDIRTLKDYENTINCFDKVVGLDYLKVIHLNDSKEDLGSHIDRHTHIGEGKIGIDAFRYIMNDKRFKGITKIIETPKGKNSDLYDRKNLDVLRSLLD